MKRLLAQVIFALATILLPLFTSTASACSCNPLPPPYEAYKEASVVFVGKVISSNVPPYEQLRAQEYTAVESVFRFAVQESFKGVKTAEVEITAGNTGTSCYWGGFTVGESYLVYGYVGPASPLTSGSLPYAGACTRTNGLTWAQDDVHYLRSMLKGTPESRVYGSLTRMDNDLSKPQSGLPTPLEGIKIVVEGEKRRFETVTDKQGLFSLDKIPNGKYKARPVLPDKYMLYFPGEEEFILGTSEQLEYPPIRQGASAYARFRVGWNNNVSGRLLDGEGNPLKRAKAAIMLSQAAPNQPLVIEEDSTDYHKDGAYRFSGLTPGSYLLAVSIDAPFTTGGNVRRFYYPSTDSPGQARGIEIKERDKLEGMDIKLTPEFTVRQIEGVLVWSDGSPVSEKGWVTLANSQSAGYDKKVYEGGDTDKQGRFSIQAFVGAEYWVHATVNTMGLKLGDSKTDLWDEGIRELRAQPIKILVGKANEPLRIVVQLPKSVGKAGQ